MNTKVFQLMFYAVRLLWPGVTVSARLPLAQAVIESGHWSSDLYRRGFNMFGMMQPQARRTASLGPDKSGYASFRSALDSIRDYFLWLEAMGIKTDAQLDAQLVHKYAADPNYYKKITAAAKELQASLLNPAALLGKAAVLAAGLGVGAAVVVKAVRA